MRKKEFILLLALIGVLLSANIAYGNPKGMGSSNPGDKTASYGATDCQLCHAGSPVKNAYGPHGKYTTTSIKCSACHIVHNKPGKVTLNTKLLFAETVVDTCQFCHDITGSDMAPYSTTRMTTSSDVQSAHRIKGIRAFNDVIDNWTGYVDVPGGNSVTGGSSILNADQGELSGIELTCDSCHTPHALKMVKGYLGESEVKTSTSANNVQPGNQVFYLTSRLLKTNLQVGGAVYSEYGSSWCAGCHLGRLHTTGNGSFNHPVNTNSTAYDWGTLAEFRGILENGGTVDDINTGTGLAATGQKPIPVVVYDLAGNQNSSVWVRMTGDNGPEDLFVMPQLNADPRSNLWYTMTGTDALTGNSRPDGYRSITQYPEGPACQQCHASARDIEEAFSIGTNPEAASFPHISKYKYLLVENNDDLCTNCHGIDNLP